MEKPKVIPDEVFKAIVKDVTGREDINLFTKEQAAEIITRCGDVMGIVEVPEEKIAEDEDSVEEILKECGF